MGLGNRQPINYPYELRYGREEAKRLARPAPITGTISTPWRVVLIGRDLNTLVNSDVLPNLCPPAVIRTIQAVWHRPAGVEDWRIVDFCAPHR